MSYKLIDISRFLPSNAEDPNILINFYNETPILTNDLEAFMNRPVNEAYKKNQEEKLKLKEEENKICIDNIDDETASG